MLPVPVVGLTSALPACAAGQFLRDIFVIPIATCGGVWYTDPVRTGWGEHKKGLVRKSDEKGKALYCRTVYVRDGDRIHDRMHRGIYVYACGMRPYSCYNVAISRG